MHNGSDCAILLSQMRIISNNERKLLKKAGMKATSQRALILDIIRQGQGHLDADEVYRRARKKDSNLSLSTVYRTLGLFKKLGLVEELHFDETHHHYEVSPSAEHHHLVCLGCGRVIEFNHPLTSYVQSNVPEAKDFEITRAEVNMTGYCPECRRKKEDEK